MVSTRATEHSTRHRDDEALQHADERREFELSHPGDGRDSSYDAANQHMVKFRKELWEVNEDIALDFDRNQNLADFPDAERKAIVDAHATAFENTGWNGLAERLEAAEDIAQDLFQPLYQRVEIAEAAMEYNVSHTFLDALQKRESGLLNGNEPAGEQLRKDLEDASRMVEKATAEGREISARQLDEFRGQFANLLYAGFGAQEVPEDEDADLDAELWSSVIPYFRN